MALIGYMRVSKSDGSQTTDLQRDALIAAGVDPGHLYEDMASGKQEDRPHLDTCLKGCCCKLQVESCDDPVFIL